MIQQFATLSSIILNKDPSAISAWKLERLLRICYIQLSFSRWDLITATNCSTNTISKKYHWLQAENSGKRTEAFKAWKSNRTSQVTHMQKKDEYQHIAACYDLLFSRSLRAVRSNICTYLSHCRAGKIIDLCCGTGEQLRMLSKEGILLTGVDNSSAMLARARKKSPESIRYLEADACRLPLADGSYDGVIISFALHEKTVLQYSAIFHEACRLLKPGGHIIIADYGRPPAGLWPRLVGNIVIPLIERTAGIAHYHNYRDWMKNGALQGFLARENPGQALLIASHFQGCIHLYAASQIKKNPSQANVEKSQLHSQAKGAFTLSLPLNGSTGEQHRREMEPHLIINKPCSQEELQAPLSAHRNLCRIGENL